MGQNIDQLTFTKKDYVNFQRKVFEQLEELKFILTTPKFGTDPLKIGAELEMYLVDHRGEPTLKNILLIDQLNDEQYQPELNQYNLELNLSAVEQRGSPFTAIQNEIKLKTQHLESLASNHETSIIPIGILPTLRKQHLDSSCMTKLPRYSCLSKHLYLQRGENFQVNINGEEPLIVDFSDICAEGANTSFQVHMMIPPQKLVNTFNAAQLTLPLVTAISGNSAVFMGHSLWDETRIALFKQSVDIRQRNEFAWQQPTRVNFGFGWVRNNIYELFEEAVSLYPPLIPYINRSLISNNELSELCFHLGTIWPWNRPVYSNSGKGHVRLEFRAIPAGPTNVDMVANAAYTIGLAAGFERSIESLISIIPFRFAEYNFYRAAQHGLNSKILWPHKNKYQPQEIDIKHVIEKSLPIAHQGLISLNICPIEASYYLGIIEHRLERQFTGAVWQKRKLQELEKTMPKGQACRSLVLHYLENYRSGKPVSTWEES